MRKTQRVDAMSENEKVGKIGKSQRSFYSLADSNRPSANPII